ncbi:hypothetical protein MYAM1_002249 [Malassezia yamatoensis]|uniref:Uncharacterized protein n=1 Tax=Malassezia yamatoensis TaxID=253288 RepID=A0AAJ5YZM7_9BASI|nr:hypothetical protein MYAM1_002249 [Malassezia yamatoensis]
MQSLPHTEGVSEQRSNLIRLAADGDIDSHLLDDKVNDSHAISGSGHELLEAEETRDHKRLTARNLNQIPEAEQLAPGIRIPEHIIGQQLPSQEEQPPTDFVHSSVTMDESDADDQGTNSSVPPELDPRTSTFKPGMPSAGSVFSVAVQPGSPRSILLDTDKRRTSPRQSEIPADSSLNSSAGDSPFSSRATTPILSGRDSNSGAAPHTQRSDTGQSWIGSDIGSQLAESGAATYSSAIREQELAIERQRMREREIIGGEIGIGGPIATPFARLPDNIMQLRSSPSLRSVSSAATVASSPAPSVRESDLDDSLLSTSRSSALPSFADESVRHGSPSSSIAEPT